MTVASHDDAVKDNPNPLARDSVFRSWWEGAVYENVYVKVNGVWRIQVLKYRPQWHCTHNRGLSHSPIDFVPFMNKTEYPKDKGHPDIIEKPSPTTIWLWPDTHVEPFHYPDGNGEWLTEEDRLAPRATLKLYPTKAGSQELAWRESILTEST